jgi:hypothetical protein
MTGIGSGRWKLLENNWDQLWEMEEVERQPKLTADGGRSWKIVKVYYWRRRKSVRILKNCTGWDGIDFERRRWNHLCLGNQPGLVNSLPAVKLGSGETESKEEVES